MTELQAPWIGPQEDYEEPIGYCECCGSPIYRDDEYKSTSHGMYCSDHLSWDEDEENENENQEDLNMNNNTNSNGKAIIFNDGNLLADFVCADLSLDDIATILTTTFPNAKRIEIVHVEYDEVLADVDGTIYVVDNNDNVYKFKED